MLYRFAIAGPQVCPELRRGSRTSEPQPPGRPKIARNGRQPLPAISIRTRADRRAVELASKLASGTIEALDLATEPARRLTAVFVEGTRNAVEHAYTDRPTGDVELELGRRRGVAGGDREELVVTIRDFGCGCPLGPTSSEPPGLGLSIISELSEDLRISSQRQAGTVIDATIRIPADRGPAPGRSAPTRGSLLTVADPAFLAPVVPRAIAVHAATSGGSVDAVRATIDGGRGIAAAIGPHLHAGPTPALMIDSPERSDTLEVLIGPIDAEAATELSERLRPRVDPAAVAVVEEHPGTGRVHVSFSLL